MSRKILDGIADICLRHSRRILFFAALAGVVSLLAASRLAFDPDILNLVPRNNKAINDFRRVLEDMGTIDYHIIVLEIPKGRDVSEYDSLVQGLADGYRSSPLIEDVEYRIPNPIDLMDKVLPRALLFLTPEELDRVAAKLTDAQIRETVARNRALLGTPQGLALKQLVQYDPFDLLPIFLEKFRKSGGGFTIDASSGYYLSQDHSMLLILTKPRRPAQDLPFSRRLITEAKSIEVRALTRFRKDAAQTGTPIPRVLYTGGYEIAFADSELIKKDIIANVLFSFFGVLGLFLYAFRRTASLAYGGIPMALGLAMTFGTAGVVFGLLSSASAGFAALLAGLGIDFITVMYGRYVDERNQGASREDAIHTMMRHTLPGVFVAAITTAGTFYAFLATDFRGMTQLGFLTGTGILFFLVCVTFVLPALIIQGERGSTGRPPRLFLHSFGSGRLIDWSVTHPRKTIIAWILFTIFSALAATQIRFSDNIQDLRAKGNPGIMTQERLTRSFGQSFDFMMYVNEAPTLHEVLEKNYQSTALLDRLVTDKVIASYQSVSTYLPSARRQEAVIAELARGQNDRFSPGRVRGTFASALQENGFRPEAYDHYLELFSQALTPSKPISLDDFHDEGLSRLLARFLKKTPKGYASVIYVYPVGGKWSREVPAPLLKVAETQPDAVLTGVNLASGVLRRIVRHDAIRATLLGFAAVLLLMFINFRSFKLTALSFVPFFTGATGMLGVMSLMSLEFNFMNVFVGLMIIGSSTDYAIYMLHRYLEDPASFHVNAHGTGKAVVMAVMTTIVGFGSFALSHYPGLRSIGYAATFGVGLSGLSAITLLPAIMTAGRRVTSDE